MSIHSVFVVSGAS